MTTCIKKEILLKAENINLFYDDKVILREVNFCIKDIVRPDVKQGQVVSLIGRSGIGKTQLFRILAGLQKPTSGTIQLRNKEMVKAGDMGVIFQNYYLFEWRTVVHSLMLAAKQNKVLEGKEKEMIDQYAVQFNLKEELNKYPQQLSGGQRQRASIIQQLLKGSDFLLLDEPFGALDAKIRKELRQWLRALHDRTHHTTLFVTHDQDEAFELADRIAVLSRGKIEQIGTKMELTQAPATNFVADFIQEAEMTQGPVATPSKRRFFWWR